METDEAVGFIKRNKVPVLQMFVAAILIMAGVFMLQMSKRPPTADYSTLQNISQNDSIFRQADLTQIWENCTPLFNSSRKISYSYNISTPSPEGTIKMKISYDYVGTERIDGVQTDVVLIKMNGTHKGMLMDPMWKIWLDSETGKCVNVVLEMSGNTISSQDVPENQQRYMLPLDCKQAQFGMPVVVCKEQLGELKPIRTETIIVPAGEFEAERYQTPNDEIMWVSEGVPVPVKFMFKSIKTIKEYAVAELIYYGEKP